MSHKILRPIIVLMLVIGLVVVLKAPQPARAAGPWYVSTTGDDNNDCLNPSTACATIIGAISKSAAGDTINVATGTYTGSGDEVVLIDRDITLSGGWDDAFTIQGDMSTIDGQDARRGVTVSNGVTATMEWFIVQNGNATIDDSMSYPNPSYPNPNDKDGGGGGIHNGGTMVVNNTIINKNNSYSDGGGIENYGTITLNNTTISNNTANFGDAINGGGGISNNGGILMVNNSTIQNNSSASFGGGIVNFNGGELFIASTGISNNSAMFAGGIYSDSLTILNNATVNNNLSRMAGGIFNGGGTLAMNNTTVSNNIAEEGGAGGGLYSGGGISIINNSTLSYNSAYVGGGFASYNDTFILQNTVVNGNIAEGGTDCVSNHDFSGMLLSSGYNLIGNTSGCTFTPSIGDLTNIDPQLGPLQDNGGSTLTHALLPGSPAIDAGNPAGCTDQDGNLLTTDQRGVARPQGAACDIGAFELEFANPVIEVSIDVKPGSGTNPINTMSKGKIPVAILSTVDFDASSMVDTSSLTFGKTGDESSLAFCNNEDSNDDGLPDLVCHFYTQSTGFQKGDTAGILNGLTMDGIPIEGSDNVKVLK